MFNNGEQYRYNLEKLQEDINKEVRSQNVWKLKNFQKKFADEYRNRSTGFAGDIDYRSTAEIIKWQRETQKALKKRGAAKEELDRVFKGRMFMVG